MRLIEGVTAVGRALPGDREIRGRQMAKVFDGLLCLAEGLDASTLDLCAEMFDFRVSFPATSVWSDLLPLPE
jgi:hypothetical protein